MDHKKYSSYGFGAAYNPWTIENKSTLTSPGSPATAFNLDATTGSPFAALKSLPVKSGTGTRSSTGGICRSGLRPNDRFQGPFNSNGQIFFQYFQNGSYTRFGAYWLSDVRVWKNLNATAGVRVDRYLSGLSGRFSR